MNPLNTPPRFVERAPREQSKNAHLYWLDVIRFLAAFAVLTCHFRGAFFVDYGLLPESQQNLLTFAFFSITRLGHEAVMIFFVLSGFLVGGKALERIRNNEFSTINYTIDRMVRIQLPLFSALLFAFIINLIIGTDLRIPQLIGNFFSLQGIFCRPYIEPLWSLSYEVWFYILMGAIGFCFTYKGQKKCFMGIITLLLCFFVFNSLNPNYLFVWLIGAFGYIGRRQLPKCVSVLSLIILIILIILMQCTSNSRSLPGFSLANYFSRPLIELLFGSSLCFFIIGIVEYVPKHIIGIMINKYGSKLAAFSYTLYLTHVPILRLLEYLGAPKCQSISALSIGLFICWLLLAMVLSYCIYLLFEKKTPIVKMWIKTIVNKQFKL